MGTNIFKTLEFIDGNEIKSFGRYAHIINETELGGGEIPNLMNVTTSLEQLKTLYPKQNFDGVKITTIKISHLEEKEIHEKVNVDNSETIKSMLYNFYKDGRYGYFFDELAKATRAFLKFQNEVVNMTLREDQDKRKQAEDEREVMIRAFVKIREEFEGRTWLMEGRGPYEWDDDEYKQEVRYIMDAFNEIEKKMWKDIKSKTFEYRDSIINNAKEDNTKLRNALEAAITGLEWEIESNPNSDHKADEEKLQEWKELLKS